MMRKKTVLIIIVITIVVLAGFRIALPIVVKDYVDKTLDEIEGYQGHIEDIDLNLVRGAYEIEGVVIEKTGGKVPVPFFSADKVDLSIEWSALFKGSLVGEIEILSPKVNFVAAPDKNEEKKNPGANWQDKVKELFPLKIDRFSIIDGEVHYRDFYSDPEVDVYLSNISATVTNITNSLDISESMVASAKITGDAMNQGHFYVNLQYDPYATQPEFNVDAELENIQLVKLNNFLKAYGNFDVQRGTFGLYTEFAASKGEFKGYLKPFFKDIEVFSWQEDHKNFFEGVWEAVTGAIAGLFENDQKEQIATKIPISGRFDDPDVDIWSTVWILLRNAFIEALIPGIEKSIQIKNVSE